MSDDQESGLQIGGGAVCVFRPIKPELEPRPVPAHDSSKSVKAEDAALQEAEDLEALGLSDL